MIKPRVYLITMVSYPGAFDYKATVAYVHAWRKSIIKIMY